MDADFSSLESADLGAYLLIEAAYWLFVIIDSNSVYPGAEFARRITQGYTKHRCTATAASLEEFKISSRKEGAEGLPDIGQSPVVVPRALSKP
jgi:uncharacterized protein YdaU (DUF1376 family)